jgi:insulysin
LFTESATEREVNAVHSEHEKNIPSDPWRSHQIEVGTANPNHPYSYFATGNRETLWTRPREKNVDVRSALMDYHRAYYSANLMSLGKLL